MTLLKHFFILLLFTFSFHISKAEKLSKNQILSINDSINIKDLSPNQISITDSIINYGKIFLNTPYRYGSTGTSTFDCSGFTSYVYRYFGFNLKRTSADQAKQFDKVNRNQLKTGDLVFFSGRHKSNNVGHVGIVVEVKDDGDFNFIHTSVHNGVTISNSNEDYFKRRFIKANRVIYDDKMLAVAPSDLYADNTKNISITASPLTAREKDTKKVIAAEYHQVKPGETLSSISKKYNISVTELKRKNNLKNSKLKLKQRLKVKDEKTILNVESTLLAENKPTEKIDVAETGKAESSPTEETPTLALHKVKKGETLISISKLYNVSVNDLKKFNKLTNNNIHFGDNIKIKNVIKPQLAKAATINSENIKSDETKKDELLASSKHNVEFGETLFSISKKYNITIDDLKRINNLTSSKIQPGQKIILNQPGNIQLATTKNNKQITHNVKSGESLYSIARTYGCSVVNLKEWNNKSEDKLNKGEKLTIRPNSI